MSKTSKYDFLIVGAGPAGMFAVYEILKKKPKAKILILERGNLIENRGPNETMIGFGGGGTFSDGKLHYTPILSHEKALDLIDVKEYEKLIQYVDDVFTNYGITEPYYPKNEKQVDELINRCQKNGIKLYSRRVRHTGTDKLRNLVEKIQKDFEKKEVEIIGKTVVEDIIIDKTCKGVICKNGKKYFADKVLLAPGRVGARWLQNIAIEKGIEYKYDKVEVGVRIEFPFAIMQKFSDQMYEAIFEIDTLTYDDTIRTFCPCPHGKVAIEKYQGFVCANGHSESIHNSENSNFAFLTEIKLTEPVENTTLYAKSIAELTTTLGGGKVIIQRLADLQKGRRSTWNRIHKSYVTPSLTDVTPGDISMALPHRIVVNILEGLEKLEKVMPGINSGSTLLYAPEVKYRGSKIITNNNLETKIKNLFVAGDGAGVSGNIIGAAVTGVMAARGMMR
ncbi:FAD-dependent oxidoreductase [Candidatus Dojkabacteria bacterium]|nr:FAD-dependent oxidoreductase [Candidatus Dojkabacteria bacterium]